MNLSGQSTIRLILLALLLVGCGTTPAATGTSPAAIETSPTPAATETSPAATGTPPSPTTASPAPAATGTPPSPAPTTLAPAPPSTNPFVSLLGPVSAPPGWTVQPCEGQAPFLCVSSGDEFPGSVELLHYPLDQREDVQRWMEEAGLEPGQAIDPGNPEQARRAREALRALRADHMGVVEEDRAITYPDGRFFVLLEPKEVRVGRLPGLFYGFAGVDEDGQVYERWLTYAALDGRNLYILTAFYDPGDTPGSMPSDEALSTFQPYLRDIVAGLKLPEG